MNNKDFVILSFDTSKTRTGWACLRGKEVLCYGAIIPPKEYLEITYQDPKWGTFLKWYFKRVYNITKRMDENYGVSFTVLEDLHIMHKNTARILHEVQAIAKVAVNFWSNEIPLNPIHNSTAKSAIGINMKGTKYTPEQLKIAKQYGQKPIKIVSIDRINKMFGLVLTYEQDDESDAIMLAYTMLKEIEKFEE